MIQRLYSGLKSDVKINFQWLATLSDSSLKKMENVYAKIPLVYRAMNIRADNLVRVPFYFFQGEKEVDKYPFEDSLPFDELIRKTEMSLMAKGLSCTLVLEKDFEGVSILGAGLQWLNPFTVRVKSAIGRDGTQRIIFEQYINGVHYPKGKDYWTEEEMYYTREFSFSDDVGAGVAPAEVALADANAIYYLSTFLNKYFEAGAIPPMIISAKEGTAELPKKEIKTWFKEKLKNFLERVLVLEGGLIDVKQLVPELTTFDIGKVDEHVILGVADAFGMSPTSLMAGSANRATAEFEDLHLMRTIEARARFHQSRLNNFLARFGYRCEARIQELPEFQEDEEQRSSALAQLTQAGVPLDRALEILGYHISEDYAVELEQKKKLRLAALTVPVNEPAQLPPGNGQLKAELKRWMKKSMQRFEEGRGAAVKFTSEIIPAEDQKRIILGLANVKSAEEIKAVFSHAEEQ